MASFINAEPRSRCLYHPVPITYPSQLPGNVAECQRPACFQQQLFSKPRRSQNGSKPGALASGLYYLAVVNKSTNERDIIKLFFK